MIVEKLTGLVGRNPLAKHLLLAIGFLIASITILFIFLNIYTHHGESLTVPDITGKSKNDAISALHKRQLDYIVYDSVYSREYEKGAVVEQHPVAGSKVKRDRKVYLTMNAFSQEKVVMPDVVQLSIRMAQARLESFGLRVGRILYEPDISVNLVLEQHYQGRQILPGDTLFKGSFVDLVLGKGLSDERTLVPDLVGLILEKATLRAADAYLRIGGAVADPEVPDNLKGKAWVYRQRPEHNKINRIPLGSSVDVWLTLDSARVFTNIIENSIDEEL